MEGNFVPESRRYINRLILERILDDRGIQLESDWGIRFVNSSSDDDFDSGVIPISLNVPQLGPNFSPNAGLMGFIIPELTFNNNLVLAFQVKNNLDFGKIVEYYKDQFNERGLVKIGGIEKDIYLGLYDEMENFKIILQMYKIWLNLPTFALNYTSLNFMNFSCTISFDDYKFTG